MNNKKKEDRKKEEIKRQFQKAVSLSNEADGRLTRDQWTKVLMDAGIKRTMWVELTWVYIFQKAIAGGGEVVESLGSEWGKSRIL